MEGIARMHALAKPKNNFKKINKRRKIFPGSNPQKEMLSTSFAS